VKAAAAKGNKPSTPVEILKEENELLKKTIAATDATGRSQPIIDQYADPVFCFLIYSNLNTAFIFPLL
jgi:hypothetical protein